MANLLIEDTRTGKKYTIPVQQHAVQAQDFAQIKARDPFTDHRSSTETGLTVVDLGLRNTAVIRSSITSLDDQRGTIQYRGYDIGFLVDNCSFEEVAHLLIWGRLPDVSESRVFSSSLTQCMEPPVEVRKIVSAFPTNAPDFTIAQAAMAAWNAVGRNHIPISEGLNLYTPQNEAAIDRGVIRTFATNAACRALASCHNRGLSFTSPEPTESIAYNVLLMYGCVDKETGKPNAAFVRILERLMILYADHEMTNSTAAFLHVASTLADPISCLIAAASAENGPLHGGAIPMAYAQFASIGSKENVSAFLQRVRNKEVRLFGFGHRIWKNGDPRYPLLKRIIDHNEELSKRFADNPTLSVAMELERQVLADEYFVKKGISPNVDLIGCLVFSALGFPLGSVLGVASVARVAGVVGHWKEQLQSSVNLWRPQAVYTKSSLGH